MRKLAMAAATAALVAAALPAQAQERDLLRQGAPLYLGTANLIINWPFNNDGGLLLRSKHKKFHYSNKHSYKYSYSYKHSYKFHGFKHHKKLLPGQAPHHVFKVNNWRPFSAINVKPGYGLKHAFGPKFSRYGHHKHFKNKIGSRTSHAGINYVQGAILCGVVSTMFQAAMQPPGVELEGQQVVDNVVGCFLPPYALYRMFGGAPLIRY